MIEVANPEQYEAWNGESGRRWVQSADRRDQVLAPIAEALLTAAEPMPGETVLDVGCGCGATTLHAAGAVGDRGRATGIDLSEPMLAVARDRADRARLTNVAFVQGDVQTGGLELHETNLVISRFGTMFFSEPTTAFANVRHVLAGDGRLCIATWQPLEANDWLTVPGAALLPYAELPEQEPAAPGMFAQADPETVRTTLAAAGFHRVDLEPVTVSLPLGPTVDDALEHLADSGPGRAVLDAIPDEQRPAALDDVRAALAEHATETGVRLHAAIWIVRAK
jgi:ubiquinone/menaquinone biosynthesis C-methylase UbiE